jgi:LysR family glycine cleavage system transcriptional activator
VGDLVRGRGRHPATAPAAPRLRADAQALEVASALADQGVALGSPIFFARDIAEGRLVAPFDIAPHYGGGYWIAYPAERRRTRKIAAFRDWILAEGGGRPADRPLPTPLRPAQTAIRG